MPKRVKIYTRRRRGRRQVRYPSVHDFFCRLQRRGNPEARATVRLPLILNQTTCYVCLKHFCMNYMSVSFIRSLLHAHVLMNVMGK